MMEGWLHHAPLLAPGLSFGGSKPLADHLGEK